MKTMNVFIGTIPASVPEEITHISQVFKTHTKCLGKNASVLANERPWFVILTNQRLAGRTVTGCDGSVVARSGSSELR